MAIALRAEYGEQVQTDISLRGRTWRMSSRALESQAASGAMSPISPMPQLSVDGIENSGTSTPAWRPALVSIDIFALTASGDGPRQSLPDPVAKHARLGQQAQHHEGLAREIEEVARMHEHVILLQQGEDERLLRSYGRHLHDRRPAAPDRQQRAGWMVADQSGELAAVAGDARPDPIPPLRAAGDQRAAGVLHGRRDREVGVGDDFEPLERRTAEGSSA